MFWKANCDLQGKCVLVTGASSGLGAHFASLFAARKAEVILAGRRIGVLEEMVQRLRVERGIASCVQVDVNDAASRKAMADSIGEIDVLGAVSAIPSAWPAAHVPQFDLTMRQGYTECESRDVAKDNMPSPVSQDDGIHFGIV